MGTSTVEKGIIKNIRSIKKQQQKKQQHQEQQ